MRILIVDDDEILVDLLTQSLRDSRHIVDIAEDGEMGWEYIESGEYELILLDIDLPRLDGVSLCEKMRSQGYTTPILLMTAKDASQERIRGLDAGADDYLIKPLDLGELHARVRALARRKEVIPSTVLDVNGLILNPTSCEVSYRERPIKLTAKEYSLLELFLRNPARVFSRSQILDRIWTFDDPPLEDSVKAHIKGLRKKLKKAGVVDWIENVYGIGYRLNPQEDKAIAKATNDKQPVVNSIEREFNDKMEQMWLKYQDKMIERLQILQNAVSQAEKGLFSEDLHQQAERSAHKLAGVLGMFSRDKGTQIARALETLLQDNRVLNKTQQEQFITWVKDLDSLLGLDTSEALSSTAETATLLLVSQDKKLSRELQQRAQAEGRNWHRVDTIDLAQQWLETNSPYIVAIDLSIANKPAAYLGFLAHLTARNPVITTIVISPEDSLKDRLNTARAGASSFLVKPVTPTLLWQTTNRLLTREKSTTASILVVDDDSVFLAGFRSLLEPWGIRVVTLENPRKFWEMLQITQPDLLILDIEMPEISGIELCQALRNDPNWQKLPTLFLTARRDAKTIQQVFEVGGDDYVSKPVVGAELIARINNRLERSRLLERLATRDTLTGLQNRYQSNRELERLLQQAKANKQAFSLAMLRIPNLPQINTQYGHLVGDRILAKWGKVIQAAFRNCEVTSYWGNGDFIIGMPNTNKIQAKENLAEVLTVLRKQIFTSLNGGRFQVTCECSVAEFTQDGKTLHSLYQACNFR